MSMEEKIDNMAYVSEYWFKPSSGESYHGALWECWNETD